jgi:hypothetical protein
MTQNKIINKRNESSSSNINAMSEGFTPKSADIICGRGCAYANHPGNRIFSEIVQAHLQEYISAPTRMGKSMVVAHVLGTVLESGARFVKKEKGTRLWTQMTREEAHNKIGHAIRDMIRNIDGKDKPNNIVGYTTCLRRSRSAEAKRLCQTTESAHPKRSRSLTDIIIAYAPKSLDANENDNDNSMSFENSSTTIQDVLRTVCDLHENNDLIKTFDDTPLPPSTFNEFFYCSVPLPATNDFEDSPTCNANMVEDEDLFPSMYDSLF